MTSALGDGQDTIDQVPSGRSADATLREDDLPRLEERGRPGPVIVSAFALVVEQGLLLDGCCGHGSLPIVVVEGEYI